MGWGTCYIEPGGYLNRVRIEQIDEEVAEVEQRIKSAFDTMTTIMASSPADVKVAEGEDPMPWPEYVKEQRDYIEDTIRENYPELMRLWAAQRAVEKKEVRIDYCANGHGQIHGDWCDEKKCHVCDAPIIGSCKLPLVDKDYA